MRNFSILIKIVCLSAILFTFSYSGQEKQTEKKTNQLTDIKETQETKTEVIKEKNGELNTRDITQNRDMTQYEQGGHIICGGLISKENSDNKCDEIKVRDFIWGNWNKKKRSYITITYNGIDAVSTSHIFIEPNDQDEWRLAWRIVRLHTMPEYSNLITDMPTIFNIERVENKPEKGQWALVFKNKEGNILEKIPDF
jgi:hypothetical protein